MLISPIAMLKGYERKGAIMYGDYYSSTSSLTSALDTINSFMAFMLVFLVLMFVANICGIWQLIKIAQSKGHFTEGAGLLWFIGLCGTSFMLGLIVCAMPDLSNDKAAGAMQLDSGSYSDELPEV